VLHRLKLIPFIPQFGITVANQNIVHRQSQCCIDLIAWAHLENAPEIIVMMAPSSDTDSMESSSQDWGTAGVLSANIKNGKQTVFAISAMITGPPYRSVNALTDPWNRRMVCRYRNVRL